MKTILLKSLTAVGLAGLLAGCETPYGEPNYTANGALIGGGAGAAIGAVADSRAPGVGALIGGGAGALTGAIIGNSEQQRHDYYRYAPVPPPAAGYAYAPAPAVAAPPVVPPPSLGDIEAMSRAGVTDDSIIAQINNSHAVYHLDANSILSLNNAGVSERVISYMINTGNTVVMQPPPPVPAETVVAAPGPDYVWQDGDWEWNGGTWIWIGGHWARPPYPHAIWVHPHWDHDRYGWHHEGGHWR